MLYIILFFKLICQYPDILNYLTIVDITVSVPLDLSSLHFSHPESIKGETGVQTFSVFILMLRVCTCK